MFDFFKFKIFDDFELLKNEILSLCKQGDTNIICILKHIDEVYPYKFTRIEVDDTINVLINSGKILKNKDWHVDKNLSIAI